MDEKEGLVPRGTFEQYEALLYSVERRHAAGEPITKACEISGLNRSQYYVLWEQYPEECHIVKRRAVEHLITITKDQQDALLLASAQQEIELRRKTLTKFSEGLDLLLDDLTNPERAVRDRYDLFFRIAKLMRDGFVIDILQPETHEQADAMAEKAAVVRIDLTQQTEIVLPDGTVLSLQEQAPADTES